MDIVVHNHLAQHANHSPLCQFKHEVGRAGTNVSCCHTTRIFIADELELRDLGDFKSMAATGTLWRVPPLTVVGVVVIVLLVFES